MVDIMSLQQDCLLLWHMDKKITMYANKNRMIVQFKVGYIYFTNMKLHKTF